MIKLHHMNWRPLRPHFRVVRTRGVINQTALVGFWLWWVVDIELTGSREKRANAIAQRETDRAYLDGQAARQLRFNGLGGAN